MVEPILVVGATGGVGQLVVAKLLEHHESVRVLTRNPDRVRQMFADRVTAISADIRQPETLAPAMADVAAVICCTGTTAFPSARWEIPGAKEWQGLAAVQGWLQVYTNPQARQQAKNGPEQVDAIGVRNLIAAAPTTLQRFVFVSSCGVERKDQFPYKVLNAYGVLDAKQQGEQAIQTSGLPYTIIRPGRLIDGPYTSYDLNTLLKATTEGKQGVVLGTGDRLNGQTSRIDVAAACVACLRDPKTINQTFELINQGTRPTNLDWSTLFAQAIEPALATR